MFWPGPQASPACSASTRCWPAKITCPCPRPHRASVCRPRLAQRVVLRLRADPSTGSLIIHGHARALSFSAARVLETLCAASARPLLPAPITYSRPYAHTPIAPQSLGSHRNAAAVDVGLLSPLRLAVDAGPPSLARWLKLPHGTLRPRCTTPSATPARRHCHGYGSRRRIAQHSPA
jgi:hypothetical protein